MDLNDDLTNFDALHLEKKGKDQHFGLEISNLISCMGRDNGDLLVDLLDGQIGSDSVEGTLACISTSRIKLIRKDFKKVSYHSSQSKGISLQSEESSGVHKCKAIDIYNEDGVKGWSAFTGLPLKLTHTTQDGGERTLILTVDTRGADIVSQLGEPDRKGGGEPMKGGGASGFGPGVWMEWSLQHRSRSILIMIELSGLEARGQDRWEKQRAGSARWGVCTVSLPD